MKPKPPRAKWPGGDDDEKCDDVDGDDEKEEVDGVVENDDDYESETVSNGFMFYSNLDYDSD